MKVKFLSDVLHDREETKSVGGMFGIVDTSSVLFEVEEGISIPINRIEENYDED